MNDSRGRVGKRRSERLCTWNGAERRGSTDDALIDGAVSPGGVNEKCERD